MRWLITADLHLSDKPRDSYRWGIFPWLAEQQRLHQVDWTFVLGDITDEKDRHSATLVNRLFNGFAGLSDYTVLMGNHDYVDWADPFFGFLKGFEKQPLIHAATGVCLIPHQPDQASFDKACSIIPPKAYVMLHGLFDGAIAETGSRLTGLRASLVEAKRPRGVWAGDIHRPQQVGVITYAGAPYRIRFGDDYKPRVLLVSDGKSKDLHYPCISKHSLTIRDADELLTKGLAAGDQVKLTIELAREEVVQWAAYKQRAIDVCKELGVEVFGPTLKLPETHKPVQAPRGKNLADSETLEGFCLAEDIRGEVKKAGLALLKGG